MHLPAGPWGWPSAPILSCRLMGAAIFFLARPGPSGTPPIPPHRVNYRANLWALNQLGVTGVVGINAVGGIGPEAYPGRLVIPEQLIDYTWGREHTYTGDKRFPLRHAEFTTPFDGLLRNRLLAAARRAGLDVWPTGTYGVTQGPRLETAAEIDRLERDGCQLVGMTAMPEAGLARELDLPYALCCLVVNQAAGRGPAGLTIHGAMEASLQGGMAQALQLLTQLVTPVTAVPPGAT